MRITLFHRLASLAGAIAIAPSFALAQLSGGVVFTPYVGLYAPANDLAAVDARSGQLGAPVSARQRSTAAFGANLSYWITNQFAFEVGTVYSGSELRAAGPIVEPTGAIAATQTETAHLWLGSAKMMMQLFPATSQFNMRLGFGPAIISRGGRAYERDASGQLTGLTDLGAAVSLCSRLEFTRNVGVRFRVEDYIYQSRLVWHATDPAKSFTFNERTQHDFVVSAGVQLFLNR